MDKHLPAYEGYPLMYSCGHCGHHCYYDGEEIKTGSSKLGKVFDKTGTKFLYA